MPYALVQTVIKTVGAVLALMVGLAVPLCFGGYGYLALLDSAQVQASLHAQYASKALSSNEARVDAAHVSPDGPMVRLRNLDGSVRHIGGILASGHSISAKSPVMAGDVLLGQVEVTVQASGLIFTVAMLMLLGCNLAALVYLGVTKIPLQALAQTNAELVEREKAIADKNHQLDTALSSMAQGLCLFDGDQKVVIANRRYAEIYGLSIDDISPGKTLRQVLEARVTAGALTHAERTDVIDAGIAKFREHVSEIVTLNDGRSIAVLRKPLPNGGLISTHEDVTDRKKADAQIAYLAMHDSLTSLPNRSYFNEKLDEACKRVGPSTKVAVLCLDLDHFKVINDTLGHPIGDELLRIVGQRLKSAIRNGDIVARLGGDEFAILQLNSNGHDHAAALAERLIAKVSEPYDIDGQLLAVGLSIGIAIAPDDCKTAASLLKNADLALYTAKNAGRNCYRHFEEEMNIKVQERRLLELDLRSALAAGQFELYYQPLIDLQSNDVVAMEALIRWNHPVRGLVSPADFIPLAEELGLIPSIGAWVLLDACTEAAKWPQNVRVAVNLSAQQFLGDTLALHVASALAISGLASNKLELEITESTLLHNTDETIATLKKLRELGVRIAMDDFGTGYSSLSYLHSFPFDKIKIDKCFVQDLSSKPESAHILRAVVGLGANLGMDTTAEGVETKEQLARLRKEGCTQVQGFYFSAPRPAREVSDILFAIKRSLAA